MKEENKIILYQDDNEMTRVSVRFANEDLRLTFVLRQRTVIV